MGMYVDVWFWILLWRRICAAPSTDGRRGSADHIMRTRQVPKNTKVLLFELGLPCLEFEILKSTKKLRD
jgi:hypothetical protein